MRRTLAFALLLLPVFTGVAAVQTATLVRDVNPAAYVPVEDTAGRHAPGEGARAGRPPGTRLFRSRELMAAGGRLYSSARDAAHGRELWVSDGTGTRLVQDLFPGGLSSDPEQLTLVGGRLYFTADDGARGREPWSLPIQ